MLLLTLRGTPTLYYGDEIGMADVSITREQVQDPFEKQVPGMGLGRDPERTPMQWDDSTNAGFTSGKPWLPLATDAKQTNVANERSQPNSLLSFYQRLIALRRKELALNVGSYKELFSSDDVLAFTRTDGSSTFLIALNFSGTAQSISLPQIASGTVELNTTLDRLGELMNVEIKLAAHEGILVRLQSDPAPQTST
jgi:alpha-glucosidase